MTIKIQVWQKCWELSSSKRIESPMVLELIARLFSDMMLVVFATTWLPLISAHFLNLVLQCFYWLWDLFSFTSENSFSSWDGEGQILLLAMKSLDSQTYQNLQTFTPALIISHYHSCCNKQRSLKFLLFNDCVFQQQNLLTQGRKE